MAKKLLPNVERLCAALFTSKIENMSTKNAQQSNSNPSAGSAKLPVISSADTSYRRCKHCGRFISYEQMQNGEATHKFIPDTHFTVEESYWVHRHCL